LNINISQWDTEHFGFKVANLVSIEEKSNLKRGIEKARLSGVKLLICRCPITEFEQVHELEQSGFLLMDTLVYYSLDLSKYAIPSTKFKSRAATDKDEEYVRQIAELSFEGYHSHYFADSQLDRQKCRELYERWAINVFHDRKLADQVLVTLIDKTVVAFAAIKINRSRNTGEIVLTSVHPEARRKGVYRDSIIHALRWVKRQGYNAMETPTQLINTPIQRAWTGIGGKLDRSYYTFHLWIK